MWTKKSHLIYIYVKAHHVTIPLVLPLYIFWECADAVEDWILTFGRFVHEVDLPKIFYSVIETVQLLVSYGSFDLVDVDAGHSSEKVKVRICLR